MDFDTLEWGNPGRDIGRFLAQIGAFLPKEESQEIQSCFLKKYFKNSRFKYEDIKNNINIHQAEMIQYIILGDIWEEKIPNPKNIENLLKKQSSLLKINN